MKKIVGGSIIGLVSLGLLVIGFHVFPRLMCQSSAAKCERITTEKTIIQKNQTKPDYYSYKGKDGVTAQKLLIEQEKVWTQFNASGMLTSLNFRQADPKKHEYWAFYINGTLASVGANSYVTKNTDTLAWKIETY